MRALPVTATVALAVLVAAAAGFLVGRGTGSDDNADKAREAARQVSESRDAAVKSARERATKSGYRRGLRVGRARGVRAERRRAQRAATAPEQPTNGAPPTTGATGTAQAQVNPDCPPGTEPNTSGGCQPYDESNGQIEPKIDDPRCYSDRPPAGCF
jgi:hypothetical protein